MMDIMSRDQGTDSTSRSRPPRRATLSFTGPFCMKLVIGLIGCQRLKSRLPEAVIETIWRQPTSQGQNRNERRLLTDMPIRNARFLKLTASYHSTSASHDRTSASPNKAAERVGGGRPWNRSFMGFSSLLNQRPLLAIRVGSGSGGFVSD